MSDIETSDIETLFLGESDPEDDGMVWDVRRDVPPEKELWNCCTSNPKGPQNHPETGPLGGLSKWQPLGRRNTKRMQRGQGCFLTGDMGGAYIKYQIDSVTVRGNMTYYHMVYPKCDYHCLVRRAPAGDMLGLVHLTHEDNTLGVKVVNATNRDWVMWLGRLDTPVDKVQVRHVSFKTHRFPDKSLVHVSFIFPKFPNNFIESLYGIRPLLSPTNHGLALGCPCL